MNYYLYWNYSGLIVSHAGKSSALEIKVPHPGIALTNIPKQLAEGLHPKKPVNDACNDEL